MFLDFARSYQLNFQDTASPIMSGILDLHHDIVFFLILILLPVLYILITILIIGFNWLNPTKKFIETWQKDNLNVTGLIHGTILEIVWTLYLR